MTLEKLEKPPIVEVACGVVFERIGDLDPLTLGMYRHPKLSVYPSHQLHPPIIDGPLQFSGIPPIRSWLVSADDAWVIQIQHDRFYLNWRARGGIYPRFSDHGQQAGVLSKFFSEFDEFSTFCKQTYNVEIRVKGIELTKIDILERGVSWNNLRDLGVMMPCLAPFVQISKEVNPSIIFRFQEEADGGNVTVSMEVTQQAKLETRLQKRVTESLQDEFKEANQSVNDVFARLIPQDERTKRFQKRN